MRYTVIVKPKHTIEALRYGPYLLKETLNGPEDECDPDLKWLVTLWLKAKGQRPQFLRALMEAGRSARPFTEFTVNWSVTAPADAPGVAYPIEGSTQAEGYFLQFMIHPDHWRLAGPCPRCGRYFLKSTRHQQRYCSRTKCGRNASVSHHRDSQRSKKLGQINQAIKEWQQTTTKEDWRSYVRQQTGVSEKLLTDWLKAGKLHEPTERQEKR